jgi:hypothetical protein
MPTPNRARTPRLPELKKAVISSRLPRERKTVRLAHLKGMVERRLEALENSYGVEGLQPWHRYIDGFSQDPSLLFQEPQFEQLTRPPLNAALKLGPSERLIFDPDEGVLLDGRVVHDRLVLTNTRMKGWPTQAWSRPFESSVTYHGSGSKKGEKSTFVKGINPAAVSRAAFREPLGVLWRPDALRLYRRYDDYIGKLPGKGGAPTKFVRVQCDRVRRATGTGYRTQLHGYPVSEAEVRRDLKDCPELLDRLLR